MSYLCGHNEFEVSVGGIPAIARVTYHRPSYGGCGVRGTLDSYAGLAEPELEELEYILLDRHGRESPWLTAAAARLGADDDVEQQVLRAMHA